MSELEKTNDKVATQVGYNMKAGMTLSQMKDVAREVLDSGLCPNNITEEQQVITIYTMGHGLGFDLMTSLNNIDNIQGKPTLSYRAVGALLDMNGYGVNWIKDFTPEQTENGTDYVTEVEIVDYNLLEKYKAELRKILDYPEDVRGLMIEALSEIKTQIKRRMNYKWSDANNAGYLQKKQWGKLPREMMRARCLVSAVRALCPQIMMGLYETTEIDQNQPLAESGINTEQSYTITNQEQQHSDNQQEIYDEAEEVREESPVQETVG